MPAPCMSLAGQQREWGQAGTATASSTSILSKEGKLRTPCKESASLKVDERLRLARERREEHLKQLASRERGWLAREEKARRHYEKHLEERRRKLEEQRQREERRRMAVEEKRRQRLKEERERYESVVQKTIERSRNAKQRAGPISQKGLHGARKSTNVSCHSLNNSATQKPQQICGPAAKNRPNRPGMTSTLHPTSNQQQDFKGDLENKKQKMLIPKTNAAKVSSSGTVLQDKFSFSPRGSSVRPALKEVSPSQECLPPLLEDEVSGSGNIRSTPQTQYDQSAAPFQREDRCDALIEQISVCNGPLVHPGPSCTSNEQRVNSAGGQSRPLAGTTDPEEALRILSEKRRQARLQREREEEENRQRQESERRVRDELARRRAEERLKQEALTQEEERRRMRDEEEQRKAGEEDARREKKMDRRFQQQREEDEARQRLIAEQQKMEREIRFQKEEDMRQERKKRLEEIMKRTRKSDAAEKVAGSTSCILKDNPSNTNGKPITNLTLEDIIKLPAPERTSTVGFPDDQDVLPAVAFKERRSIRSMTALEKIQAHQRAEVI